MATKEETKRMIEVMQAYVEGCEIEYKVKNLREWKGMMIEPYWNWYSSDYRIKEEVKHKYKVGDYVLVLDGSDIPDYTGNWAMTEYVGKIYKIRALKELEGLPTYYLSGDTCCLNFDERGLALVKIGE